MLTRMLRAAGLLASAALVGACCFFAPEPPDPIGASAAPVAPVAPVVRDAPLPPEARPVLDAIARGGPFAYPRDGVVFQNREHRLPERARGSYHEYTVATPGARDRGARRIVTGGDPPTEYWYTDDHYASFRRFDPEAP